MEDETSEVGLSFDFETNLETLPLNPTASVPTDHPSHVAAPQPSDHHQSNGGGSRRSYRQTVCRHWLRGLCMKGDACGFLHQYDKARMPVCRFFRLYGECREQDCVYKHTNDDIKECNMYKLGFCPNGPDCRYRHAKLPGPPPPVEEVLQKIQQITSYNYGNNNRFFQNRNSNYPQQFEKPQFTQGQNAANQGLAAKSSMTESPSMQMQQAVQPSQQQVGQTQVQNFPNGQQNQGNRTAIPLPQGISRYFIVKSCNRENFELSVQQGVWATQRSNEAKLNEAFDSVENVILIFSVNRTRNFQGCAKMTSRTGGYVGGGNWKYAHGTAHYGRNFSVKWLKLCELSFQKTRHLRNPFNENLPVKISRDCQELEPSVGEQLASLLYVEPDSELMAISLAAEAKREEEKAKGVNPENGTQNPDIVPFEDNEEEEEEDDEEEEESDEEDDAYGSGSLGRGRGRGGMMWPPLQHMPLARGGPRPMRGFPPVMMGAEGFPYGMPGDIFNMSGGGPRPFGPFGPRFPGDFAGPMFQGRPPFGMVGPGRGPFMGPVRGGRPPMGVNPMFPPLPSQQLSNRPSRRGPANDNRNERYSAGSDQVKGEETGGSETEPSKQTAMQEDQTGPGSGFKNTESESEDEAPRRSRHGEGKKKRRSSEGDASADSDQ